MQVQSSWKVAANLELLYGFAHPTAQLHTSTTTNINNDNMNVDVDARNTCNIDDTFYGSIQDVMSSIKVKRQLIRYYYFMLSKIDLRDDVSELGMELEQELNKTEEIQEEQQKENTINKNNKQEDEENVKCKHDDNVETVKLEVKSEVDNAHRGDTNINDKSHKDCKEEEEEEQLEKKEEELEEQHLLEHNTEECNSHVGDLKGSDDFSTTNVENVKSNTEVSNGNAKKPSYSFRARGILTEIHDPSLLSSEALLPWEFYVINTNSTNWEDWSDEDINNDHDNDDNSDNSDDNAPDYNDKHIIKEKGTIRYREQYNDEINNTERLEEYTNAFRALVKEKISLPSFVRAIAQQSIMHETPDKNKTLVNGTNSSTKSVHDQNIDMSIHMNANQQSNLQNDQTYNTFAHSDSVRKTRNRLSLYTRLAESFTGIYPGMAIGVIGEPFQWSATGVLTGVLVHKFVLPSRPCFPWSRSESFEVMMPCKFKCERSLELSTSREQENENEEEEEEEQGSITNNKKKTEDYEVSKRLVYTPEVELKEKNKWESVVDRAEPENTLENMTPSEVMRIHFCSGPFPRRDTHALLRLVVTQALTREADLLVIGGPLIKPFEEFDKQLLPLINGTFNDLLDGYVDVIEETLQQWRQEHELTPYNKHNSERDVMLPQPHKLKVILIPHRDDVTQIPVLPQTLYALSDTEDIYMRSNPCRISYRGVHIGVCNEDVVGAMQEQMVERWPHTEGNLRRVVETLVQSRVYTPIMQLPLKTVDVRYLHKLRIDYEPHRSSVRVENTNKMNSSEVKFIQREKTSQCRWEDNWNLLKSYLLEKNAQRMSRYALSSNKHNATTVKRAKTESLDDDNDEPYKGNNISKNKIKGNQRNVKKVESSKSFDNSDKVSSVEFMPHIIFLPSTRPQFAYVTHRGVANTSSHNKFSAPLKKIVDEADIDSVEDATGVLVINQEVWSRRTSAQFALRVAEVTINDSRRAALCGARASTGVSCGLLHIFNANV